MHIKNKRQIWQLTKVQKVILALFKNNWELSLTRLAKEAGITLNYTYLLSNELIKGGLITKQINGRVAVIRLTKKGIEFGKLLKGCEMILNG